MTTYTAYKLNLDESLSHKELLNNVQEVEEWLTNRKFNNVVIVEDATGKAKAGFRVEDSFYTWSKYNAS